MSGTVPVHSEHVDTNEQVRVQCHVIILNTIEHFMYSSGAHLLIILLIHVYNCMAQTWCHWCILYVL